MANINKQSNLHQFKQFELSPEIQYEVKGGIFVGGRLNTTGVVPSDRFVVNKLLSKKTISQVTDNTGPKPNRYPIAIYY